MACGRRQLEYRSFRKRQHHTSSAKRTAWIPESAHLARSGGQSCPEILPRLDSKRHANRPRNFSHFRPADILLRLIILACGRRQLEYHSFRKRRHHTSSAKRTAWIPESAHLARSGGQSCPEILPRLDSKRHPFQPVQIRLLRRPLQQQAERIAEYMHRRMHMHFYSTELLHPSPESPDKPDTGLAEPDGVPRFACQLDACCCIRRSPLSRLNPCCGASGIPAFVLLAVLPSSYGILPLRS